MIYLKITITDTMSFWDDYVGDYIFDPANSKTFSGWYHVPEDWLHDGMLAQERRADLLKYMYGESWQLGNGDGSKYIVLKMEEHKLTDKEIAEKPWMTGRESCYAVGTDGKVNNIDRDKM